MNLLDISQTNPVNTAAYEKVLAQVWDDEDTAASEVSCSVRQDAQLVAELKEKGSFLFFNPDILEMIYKENARAHNIKSVLVTVLSDGRGLQVDLNNLYPIWSPTPGAYEVFLVVRQTCDLTTVTNEDEVPSSHYLDVVEYNEQLIAELFLIGKKRSEEDNEQIVAEAVATLKQLSSQAEELNQSGESDIPLMFEFPIVVAPLTWM